MNSIARLSAGMNFWFFPVSYCFLQLFSLSVMKYGYADLLNYVLITQNYEVAHNLELTVHIPYEFCPKYLALALALASSYDVMVSLEQTVFRLMLSWLVFCFWFFAVSTTHQLSSQSLRMQQVLAVKRQCH